MVQQVHQQRHVRLVAAQGGQEIAGDRADRRRWRGNRSLSCPRASCRGPVLGMSGTADPVQRLEGGIDDRLAQPARSRSQAAIFWCGSSSYTIIASASLGMLATSSGPIARSRSRFSARSNRMRHSDMAMAYGAAGMRSRGSKPPVSVGWMRLGLAGRFSPRAYSDRHPAARRRRPRRPGRPARRRRTGPTGVFQQRDEGLDGLRVAQAPQRADPGLDPPLGGKRVSSSRSSQGSDGADHVAGGPSPPKAPIARTARSIW
jgi:hypothetical protein